MSQPTVPHRAAPPSRLRRVARLVLLIGSAAAVASVFGPIWAVRVGVLLAVVAAAVAVTYAWREAAAERRAGAAALLAASREHGEALTTERTRNGEVVDVLTTRVATTRRELADRTAEVGRLTGTVADLTGSVVTLRGDVSTLWIELAGRDATIDGLRDAVAAREAELRALAAEHDSTDHDDAADAEVHGWPRRVWSDGTGISNYEPVRSVRMARPA